MQNLIASVIANVPDSDKAEFSVHCHNDLGMAVANSLGGVLGGARQIECTVNGLGERAGNTSLEEVVMAMHTRPDLFGQHQTRIETKEIYHTSKTVYNIIGQTAPLNKPIVGRNAFLHESGIHQHGVLANKQTYEILTPESVGIRVNNIVLGKHSGRHALETRLHELGYDLTAEELNRCFEEFKVLADKKKDVTDADLEALVTHNATDTTDENGYKLDWFAVHTTNFTTATSTVSLKLGDEKFERVCLGDGPIDAAFKAIDEITKPVEHTFEIYQINSISQGKDTLGDVNVKLKAENRTFSGRGLSTDIIEASLMAYIGAINKLRAYMQRKEKEA
jgi:Isopropylmalate/homocitrate/citramalate synthases